MWANSSRILPNAARRDALKSHACGSGYLAFAGLAGPAIDPLAPRDYRPRLETDDGKTIPFDDARAIANTGAKGTEQGVHRHDLHATILHLLGLDHETHL